MTSPQERYHIKRDNDKRDKFKRPKGTWRPLQDRDKSGRLYYSAMVCCPGCEKVCSLLDHTIDSDGTVNPSLGCPFCSFHEFVILDDWIYANENNLS